MKKITIANKELFPVIENSINEGQKVSITVVGQSMLPFFKDSQTSVTLAKHEKLHKFDIILFRLNNQYYLHRIIRMKNDHFICQGDALIKKEYLTLQDIIGKVEAYHYKDKTVNCSNKWYQLKVKVWMFLKPIRRLLILFFR
jgi:hypothetical protein